MEQTGNIPPDRVWLKTWESLKGDRLKEQTLGSKDDAKAKKNQTWPKWLENEQDKQEVLGQTGSSQKRESRKWTFNSNVTTMTKRNKKVTKPTESDSWEGDYDKDR